MELWIWTYALQNTNGFGNTADGVAALQHDTTSGNNTASGDNALKSNSTGFSNTADGLNALESNTTGGHNTATGIDALLDNTTGGNNTASGADALQENTIGNGNTASGANALLSNTGGSYNSAAGLGALKNNTIGNGNTASGYQALFANTTGSNNSSLGYQAGYNLTTGSNNIDIANMGVAAESNTIRIGTNQTKAYIAGISGTMVTGDAVVVTKTGQLGIVVSSARYKRDIQDMGSRSGELLKLRPVTFRYRSDPTGALQYGLVAEEVAKVYPELVSYGSDGKPMTVHYLMLSAMLLNELRKQNSELQNQIAANQRQAEQLQRQSQQLGRQAQQIKKMAEVEASTRRALDAQRADFEQRLSRLEESTQAKDGNRNLVAAFNK